jgi:hypothetical protein
VGRLLNAAAAGPALAVAYLLTLLIAAARRREPEAPADAAAPPSLRWLILIPAHDEQEVIGATLAAVAALSGPPDARRIVVVADHCTDRTAAIAAGAGASVLERAEGARGKGAALQWALARERDFDAALILDADCIPSANVLTALNRRMGCGARVLQVDYTVSNFRSSSAAALRHAAFLLMNTVRPLGKDALGLSAGLRGTGMAFREDVLARNGWVTRTLAEDHEQHCRLVSAGERVRYVPEAGVRSAMPTSLRASGSQQLRWESARWSLLCRWAPRLLAGALRRRDLVRADAAVEMLVPPQSLLAVTSAGILVAAAALGERTARRIAALALLGQAAFVLGGLRLARAGPATYRALACAPLLVGQKLAIVARLTTTGAPRSFERTPRETPHDRTSRRRIRCS